MVDGIGKVVRIPTSILSGTDEFIKQIAARGRTRADLTIAGMEKGLSGPQLDEFVSSTMNELFVEGHGYHIQGLFKRGLDDAKKKGLSGPQAKEHAKKFAQDKFDPSLQTLAEPGQKHARESTFTEKLDPQSLPAHYQRMVIAHPMLRLITPFVRTPTNIAYHAIQRLSAPIQASQAALANLPAFKRLKTQGWSLSKDIHSGDPVRKAEALGRATAAAGFLTVAYGLASSNRITGRGPSDPEQRRLLQATGWVPYSIKTDEGYVQFSRLDPFATLLGTFADTWEFSKWAPEDRQEDVETILMGSVVALANNFTNKSYLTGVKAFVDAVSQPDKKMSSFIQQYAGAAIPNYVPQSIIGPGEENLKDVRGVLDAVMARTPWLSDEIEPLRNVLGEPVKKLKSAFASETGGITDAFLPIAYRAVSDDVVANELRAVGHGFSPPKAIKGKVDLTTIRSKKGQTAYDRWGQLHGTVRVGRDNLRQALLKVIRHRDYQAMPLESTSEVESPRIAVLRRVIGRYRRAAWAQLLEEFPEVAAESARVQQLQTLARIGG